MSWVNVALTNTNDGGWLVTIDHPELQLTAKVPRLPVASRLVSLLATINPAAFIPVPQPIMVPVDHTIIAPTGQVIGHKTAGELLASRQHEAAEGGEQSPCIGSICSVGE